MSVAAEQQQDCTLHFSKPTCCCATGEIGEHPQGEIQALAAQSAIAIFVYSPSLA